MKFETTKERYEAPVVTDIQPVTTIRGEDVPAMSTLDPDNNDDDLGLGG